MKDIQITPCTMAQLVLELRPRRWFVRQGLLAAATDKGKEPDERLVRRFFDETKRDTGR